MDRQSLGDILNIADLPLQLKRVDSAMGKIIATNPLGSSAKQLIKAGGKRLRPSLVIACARLGQPETDNRTILAAAAVELLHLASLVHDDVIDNADFRRGLKTLNVTKSAGHSILVGDYLISRSIGTATSLNQKLGLILSDVLTQMTVGLSAEPGKAYKQLNESYFDIVRKKTAAMMSAACQIGGICGGLVPAELESLKDYGVQFGISFQIIDDILDGDIKKPSIAEARQIVQKNNRQAARFIKAIGSPDAAAGLASLPESYLKWALKNFDSSAIV